MPSGTTSTQKRYRLCWKKINVRPQRPRPLPHTVTTMATRTVVQMQRHTSQAEAMVTNSTVMPLLRQLELEVPPTGTDTVMVMAVPRPK